VSVTTTSASTALTAPAGTFVSSDVGRTITGTGIPAGATLSAVASATAATLSANATASATVTATLGALTGGQLGFSGWSPETDTEAGTYSVAAKNAGQTSPSMLGNAYTPQTQRGRG
jgi:hypothetical protein